MDIPKLALSREYDLGIDAVHLHRDDTLPVVTVPGDPYPYQRAKEAPYWTWPQNADKIGMIRAIIDSSDPKPVWPRCLGYKKEDEGIEGMLYAFMYTHRHLNCERCILLGRRCLQYDWDAPDLDEKWPNPITKTVTPAKCWGCRVDGCKCSNLNVDILSGAMLVPPPTEKFLASVRYYNHTARVKELGPPNELAGRYKFQSTGKKRSISRSMSPMSTDSASTIDTVTELTGRPKRFRPPGPPVNYRVDLDLAAANARSEMGDARDDAQGDLDAQSDLESMAIEDEEDVQLPPTFPDEPAQVESFEVVENVAPDVVLHYLGKYTSLELVRLTVHLDKAVDHFRAETSQVKKDLVGVQLECETQLWAKAAADKEIEDLTALVNELKQELLRLIDNKAVSDELLQGHIACLVEQTFRQINGGDGVEADLTTLQIKYDEISQQRDDLETKLRQQEQDHIAGQKKSDDELERAIRERDELEAKLRQQEDKSLTQIRILEDTVKGVQRRMDDERKLSLRKIAELCERHLVSDDTIVDGNQAKSGSIDLNDKGVAGDKKYEKPQ